MKHIVIIGASVAGVHAAEAARAVDDTVQITVVSEEPYPPYQRYRLLDVLAGNLRESEITYRPAEFFKEQRIEWLRPVRVEKINPLKRRVTLDNKNRLTYDALIIASGSRIALPKDIKGTQRHGVCGVRSLAAIKDMIELLPISQMACVWGAGVAGVQAAAALQKRGLAVKIIEPRECILAGVADARLAGQCAAALQQQGIEIITATDITEIFGNGDVKAVRLSTGKVVACGIVGVDAFKEPALQFLKETDLVVAETGIEVDEYLRCSSESVFAAGDAVQIRDAVTNTLRSSCSWLSAAEQGTTAGRNAALFLQSSMAKAQVYSGAVASAQWRCGNLECLSVGLPEAAAPGDLISEEIREEDGLYRKLVVRDDRLVGMVACGSGLPQAETVAEMIAGSVDISSVRDSLLGHAEPSLSLNILSDGEG